MVMVARGEGWVCVCGWVGGGCDVIFKHNRGGLELFFFVLEGGTV